MPKIATGMPAITAYVLVKTISQFPTKHGGFAFVKCSTVKYVESAKPSAAKHMSRPSNHLGMTLSRIVDECFKGRITGRISNSLTVHKKRRGIIEIVVICILEAG